MNAHSQRDIWTYSDEELPSALANSFMNDMIQS